MKKLEQKYARIQIVSVVEQVGDMKVIAVFCHQRYKNFVQI